MRKKSLRNATPQGKKETNSYCREEGRGRVTRKPQEEKEKKRHADQVA